MVCISITFESGSVIFMTTERAQVMEYLTMEISANVAFILRPPPISYVSNIYYLSFTEVVWICSISLVIFSTIVIAAILKVLVKYDEGAQHMKTSDFIIFAIASTCQMGSDVFTNVLSARISIVCIQLDWI